jgi:hypothetical protein
VTNVYHAEFAAHGHTFRACGASRKQALQAILNAYTAHTASSDGPPAEVRPEDVHVTRIVLGQGYRDDGPLGDPAVAEGVNAARIDAARRAPKAPL